MSVKDAAHVKAKGKAFLARKLICHLLFCHACYSQRLSLIHFLQLICQQQWHWILAADGA